MDKWPSYIPAPVFASALLELQFSLAPEDPLRKSLQAIYAQTSGDIEKQRAEVAAWFDGVMDRASGWYKRQTNLAALVISMVMAALLNLDSIALINTINANDILRDSLVNHAGTILADPPAQTDPPVQTGAGDDLDVATKKVQTLYAGLKNTGIPMGWNSGELPDCDDVPAWIRKIAGILLTGVAGALGGPVWFELLSKIVSLRATGVKPKPVEPAAS
ncbi:MAG: hypothetical protein HC888_13465 [Candidatus Competibacteraceae bacterium]|nr:hypothetical protein [Candidatus Competibacteraceae bacterium]